MRHFQLQFMWTSIRFKILWTRLTNAFTRQYRFTASPTCTATDLTSYSFFSVQTLLMILLHIYFIFLFLYFRDYVACFSAEQIVSIINFCLASLIAALHFYPCFISTYIMTFKYLFCPLALFFRSISTLSMSRISDLQQS